MGKRLYPRLAWQAIRNNRRFYVPYLLALIGNIAAYYIMSALVLDPGVENMTPGRPNGYMYVQVMMTMGMVIAFLFSAIFVLYVNSFLMKRRKKELGLYNILGMGKGHIAAVLFYETVYVALIAIPGGLLGGVVLHKLVTLALHKLLRLPVPFGMSVSLPGMALTAALFGGLILLTLLTNLNKVRVAKPIELLRGGNVGEREPKTRWLLTLLGIVTLGAGYIIAVRATNGVDAIATYFLAVFLVIIGTYCLFTAVSIFVLKALRRNKKFYYQTSHFIGVSGMLYRMKQNAVGLANICILCTMVMVMLSGTLSLYLGTAEIVEAQTPGDVNVEVQYDPASEDPFDPAAMLSVHRQFIEDQGFPVTKAWTGTQLSFGAGRLPDGSYTTDCYDEDAQGGIVTMTVMTQDQYAAVTGEKLGLQEGQAAVYGQTSGDALTIHWVAVDEAYRAGEELGTDSWSVAKHLPKNPTPSANMTQIVTVVVADEDAMLDVFQKQAAAYGARRSYVRWYAYFNVDATEEELIGLYDDLWQLTVPETREEYAHTGSWASCSYSIRYYMEVDMYGLAGGFLFLGIFLGFIFLMATVLIIYYKQISEGYEDKERFEIMQKVGLSRQEVKTSIRSQILMVFFLPIAVAAVHILFDFNMVEKLLTLFMLQNTTLTALCTLGTVLVFFLVYGAVYLLTARTYYKIVER